MSTKGFIASLLGLCCCVHAASAQNYSQGGNPPRPVNGNLPHTLLPNGEPEHAGPPDYQLIGAGLSDWITYRRNSCCEGNVGGSGPIGSEFFLRVGPSTPVGGDIFDDSLETGWMIQVGVRSLFFNVPATAAWTVDASISNNNNRGNGGPPVLLPESSILVSFREWNRTFVNVGVGRQWYLAGSAYCRDTNLRFGIDGGGRYGSGHLETVELRHETDVLGGVYAGVQTDYEFPWQCCMFQVGFRLEWAYTWSDILQQQSNMQDLNYLVNFGVRY